MLKGVLSLLILFSLFLNWNYKQKSPKWKTDAFLMFQDFAVKRSLNLRNKEDWSVQQQQKSAETEKQPTELYSKQELNKPNATHQPSVTAELKEDSTTSQNLTLLIMHKNLAKQVQSIYFYPWDKFSANYNTICLSILTTLQSFDGPVIVNSGYRGGIGHVAHSFFFSFVYAILLKRPLYLHLKPHFYANTNSCFQFLEYPGNISTLTKCPKDSSCFTSYDNVKSLVSKPVLIQDLRIHHERLFTSKNLDLLMSTLNIEVPEYSWKGLKQLVYRMFFNPSTEVISTVSQYTKQLNENKMWIGAHIRCGGKLADTKEGVYWIDERGVDRIQFVIRKAIRKTNLKGKKMTIFIASDSSKVVSKLQSTLYHRIITQQSLIRGHTTSSKSNNVFKSALIDLMIVAHAPIIINTHVSGFSEAILTVAGPHRQFVLPFDKVIPQ